MVKFSKVRGVKSPERGTQRSAGIDFFVPNDFKATLGPHSDLLIPSGVKINMPEGYMLLGADKSGVVTSAKARMLANMPSKKDAFLGSVIIGAKVIDEDYQGEIHIHVINISDQTLDIKPGMKIAQFIFVPVSYFELQEVPEDSLFSEKSERGTGGFGSTNRIDKWKW